MSKSSAHAPAPASELVERVTHALRQPDAPTTVADLAARLEVRADQSLQKAVDAAARDLDVVCFWPKQRAKEKARVEPDAPIYAPSSLDDPRVLAHVLAFIFDRARTAKNFAFSPSELEKKLRGTRGKSVRRAIERSQRGAGLPPGFGAVWRNNAFLVFPLADLAAAPATGHETTAQDDRGSSFADDFDRAFDALNQAQRNLNFVKLGDLRRALSAYDREAFDRGLRALRLDERYDLVASEGTHGSLSDEDRQAGIVEAGARLVYCQRISD